MASYTQSSLFEPSPDSSLTQASEWIDAVVFGEVAIALCVLAVAFVGFAMLTGRFAMRGGLRVLLGCFILLGAPVIAGGLIGAGNVEDSAPFEPQPSNQHTDQPTRDLPPANFDPYSGA